MQLTTCLSEWLESKKARLEKQYQRFQAGKFKTDPDGEQYACTPGPDAPQNDIMIEWVYVIDFDRMAFSVDNGAHFRLDNIPRERSGEPNMNWDAYLSLDGKGSRCLRPNTPKEYVADWVPQVEPSSEGLAVYEVLNTGIMKKEDLKEEVSTFEMCSKSLAMAAFKTLLNKTFGELHNACQYAPEDGMFQKPAKKLLCSSAPIYGTMSFTRGQDGYSRSKSKKPEKESKNNPLYYQFRGSIIRFSTRLDSESHLRAAVGETVQHIRAKEEASANCTALLWSIRHVVVVKVIGDKVTHSGAIPVLAAYGQDDDDFEFGIHLLSYFLRPAVILEASCADITHSPPAESSKSPDLPSDVIAEIVSYTDTPTFECFSLVSRATRALWARQSRIGHYAILRGQSHPGTTGRLGNLTALEESAEEARLQMMYYGNHPSGKQEGNPDKAAKRVYVTYPGCTTLDAFYVMREG